MKKDEIEKEIGISADKLIAFFKGEVYIKQGDRISYAKDEDEEGAKELWENLLETAKDYGKGWALTKEELEHE